MECALAVVVGQYLVQLGADCVVLLVAHDGSSELAAAAEAALGAALEG